MEQGSSLGSGRATGGKATDPVLCSPHLSQLRSETEELGSRKGSGFLSESVLGGQRLRPDRQRRDMDRGEGTEEVRGPRSLAVKGGTGLRKR